MKIGQILLRTYNGSHVATRLVVLHNYQTGVRVLYDLDNDVIVGDCHALYSTITNNKLTKAEIKEVSEKAGLYVSGV